MALLKPPYADTPREYSVPTLVQARAVHAFEKGEASPEQQKIFFGWLFMGACSVETEDMEPGQPDLSGYFVGRRSVALQINWVLGKAPETFRKSGQQD